MDVYRDKDGVLHRVKCTDLINMTYKGSLSTLPKDGKLGDIVTVTGSPYMFTGYKWDTITTCCTSYKPEPKTIKTTKCNWCGAPLSISDMDIDKGVCKCIYCDSFNSLY